jgi:hypothetical protein
MEQAFGRMKAGVSELTAAEVKLTRSVEGNTKRGRIRN